MGYNDAPTRDYAAFLAIWNGTNCLSDLMKTAEEQGIAGYGALLGLKNQAIMFFHNTTTEPPRIRRREIKDYQELLTAIQEVTDQNGTLEDVCTRLQLNREDLIEVYHTLKQWYQQLPAPERNLFAQNDRPALPALPASTQQKPATPAIIRTPTPKKSRRPGADIVAGLKCRSASEVATFVLEAAYQKAKREQEKARKAGIPIDDEQYIEPHRAAITDQIENGKCARTGLPLDWRLGAGAKNLPLAPVLVAAAGHDKIDAQADVVVRMASLQGFQQWPLAVLDAMAAGWAAKENILQADVNPLAYLDKLPPLSGRVLSSQNVAGLLYSRAVEKAEKRGLSAEGLTYPHVEAGVLAGACPVTGIRFDHREQAHKKMQNPWRASLDRVENSDGYADDNVAVVCNGFNKTKGIWSQKLVIWMLAGRAATMEILKPGYSADFFRPNPNPTEEYMPDDL